MNILTDEEITDLTGAAFDDHAWEGTTAMSVALARSIEAAVIKRLAAGVSVELTKLCTDNRGTTHYGYTEDQLTTAIAAARVQENERCAEELDGMKCNNKTATSAIKQCAEAIRALLGKEQS